MRRLRVDGWLDDDPYPRAEVRGLAATTPTTRTRPRRPPPPLGPGGEVTVLLRRAAALGAELGEPAPPVDLELADDPAVASYQATAVAPLGPGRPPGAAGGAVGRRPRRGSWRELLRERIELLEARLAAG